MPGVWALEVTNPESHTSRDLLIGSVDVENARVGTRDPDKLVDLAGVPAGVRYLTSLQVELVEAGLASVLVERVLRVRKERDRAIGTGLRYAASDSTQKEPVAALAKALSMAIMGVTYSGVKA